MSTEYPSPPMESVQLVDVLHALSDPTRLRIVQFLSDGAAHPKGTSNWADWDIDLQKSAMSYHFKALREAGITNTLVEGRNHSIQLRRAELDARFPGLIDALIAAPKQG